jgi:hypothetical protein
VTKALMSRSARILMEGWVRVPADSFLTKSASSADAASASSY